MFHTIPGSLVFLASLALVTASEPPTKLATQCRLDILADARVGSVDEAALLLPGGSVQRMNWLKEEEQPRSYTVSTPITPFAWREFAFRFRPSNQGKVTLTLLGPWEKAADGTLFKQEVLWDSIRAEGASISNGSFETIAGDGAVGWTPSGGVVLSGSSGLQAADGNRLARTWHDARLATQFEVEAGKPVTIRWSARSAIPAGFEEMQRIAGNDSPAHRAMQRFMRGVNFGNYLEAPRGQDWGAKYDDRDFDHVRRERFDHVRLPIAWQHYTGPEPDFKISDEIWLKADSLVDAAVRHQLNAIVNIHHFDAFTSNPAQQLPKLRALWQQIAAHYANAPDSIAFELLNEPKDAATTDLLVPIYAELIPLIRKTNPRRTIFVGPGRWNSVSELPLLRLPDDDLNLIVTVHGYEPFFFTHQGASWAGPDVRVKGIRFPGPPGNPLQIDPALRVKPQVRDWIERYNHQPTETNPCGPAVVRGIVQSAKEWSDYYGRPVHWGEFGCYIEADEESRANYVGTVRRELDTAQIGWALWDWKAGFRYWDEESGRPARGMHEALFSK